MLERIKSFIVSRQSTLISGVSALLIIVLGFLLFSYFSSFNKQTADKQANSTEESSSSGLLTEATRSSLFDELSVGKTRQSTPSAQKSTQSPSALQKTETGKYTIVRGDTLSSIAMKYYGSSAKYTLISNLKENNITNPNLIHSGNVFTIPNLELASTPAKQPTQLPASGIVPTGLSQSNTNVSQSYTVKSGDSLWNISTEFYSSGFEWEKIKAANSGSIGFLSLNGVTSQALIVPGQVLTIPSS